MNVDEQAVRFIRNLVQLYFNNCDLSELSKKIKKEKISWIGTGAHETGNRTKGADGTTCLKCWEYHSVMVFLI